MGGGDFPALRPEMTERLYPGFDRRSGLAGIFRLGKER